MFTVICIFFIALCSCLMFIIPPASQIRASVRINPEKFKKVKIKRFSFMFRGIGGRSSIYGDVKKYGIIVPMFVIHIIGYVLCVFSIIITCVLYFGFKVLIRNIALVVFGTLVFEIIICIITIIVCEHIGT